MKHRAGWAFCVSLSSSSSAPISRCRTSLPYRSRNSINQWQSRDNKAFQFGLGISDTIPGATPVIRSNPVFTLSDDLNWVKGKHTLKFGASYNWRQFFTNTTNPMNGSGYST